MKSKLEKEDEKARRERPREENLSREPDIGRSEVLLAIPIIIMTGIKAKSKPWSVKANDPFVYYLLSYCLYVIFLFFSLCYGK